MNYYRPYISGTQIPAFELNPDLCFRSIEECREFLKKNNPFYTEDRYDIRECDRRKKILDADGNIKPSKPRKASLETLYKRRESLQAQLDKEREHQRSVMNRIGWGAGMRRSHVTPSFAKEDRLKERLAQVERQIREAEQSR